jgi:hypothetical protein
MGKHSGAFFGVISGRWITMAEILADGTITDRHGVEIDPIPLDDEVFTVREVASAVILSGKRTRLDVVNTAGLTLTDKVGKGRNTLRRIVELRCKDAANVIAAYEQRYFSATSDPSSFEVEAEQAA